MKGVTILLLFAALTVCNFCGKDFLSINRHSWRCKQKIDDTTSQASGSNHSNVNNINNAVQVTENQTPCNSSNVKCVCGKECKGLRGLKMHQRTCRTIKTLNDEVISDSTAINHTIDNSIVESTLEASVIENPAIKPGVKLPKSDEEWSLANTFFHANLCNIVVSSNLDNAVDVMNTTVYEYFKDSHGYKNASNAYDNNLIEKYKTFTKNQLKKELKRLKFINQDENAIRYVSKLLRSKVSKNKVDIITSTDNDLEISKGFWAYVKKVFTDANEVLPTFSKEVCTDYFKRTFNCVNPKRCFSIPTWIPNLKPPTKDFDISAPSYSKICKIVKRMKSSGSPCPLDQISIICFKRCPYLRTFIGLIITEVLKSKNIPKAWSRAVTILIYKKGEPNNPENFRPITLEPVALKIFTSLVRNRVFQYLMDNQYIECHYQKGFTPGISGTFEHIAEMSYLIDHSRLKQKSLTITLIDLKNAFGEVDHNLLQTVLQYHHVPKDICELVKSLYSNFHLAVITKEFTCNFIQVKRGVLQGDSFSPLIFNMLVNTFIQSIQEDQYTNFGYRISSGFKPRNWFQFADDAAAITCLESENQFLLNVFSRWCNWADMIVKVSKCHSFGMCKKDTSSVQYKPKLYINNLLIGPVEIDDSFTYLGRHFDFKMTNNMHKEEVLKTINDLFNTIDRLPLHPRNKLLLYKRYVLAKISWHLTVADLSVTWVKNNVNSIASKFIRSWLEIPISGTLDILQLTKSKFGLGLVLPSDRFTQCQVTFRNSLKNSTNSNIRKIHSDTSKDRNIQYDQYLTTKDALKKIRNMKEERVREELQTQSLVIKSIWDYALSSFTNTWSNVLNKMPRNIYSFINRYLSNTLANGSNAVKWGISSNSACPLCTNTQTLGHVVGGCTVALDQKRYNWRHDSILLAIAKIMSRVADLTVYCDLDQFQSPSVITGEEKRPDMVLVKDQSLFILELTVGFETNIEKNSVRKNDSYTNLLVELSHSYNNIKYINLSMGAVGIIGKSAKNMKQVFLEAGLSEMDLNYCISKVINVCIRATYFLFCKRDKEWEHPELLSW